VLLVDGRVRVGRLVYVGGRAYVLVDGELIPLLEEGKPERALRFEVSEEVLEKYRRWLPSRHRRRAARDPETVEKYVSYLRKFYECSRGVVSPETILRCATNKHYVRALRAFLEMLSFYGEAPREVVYELYERLRWSEKPSIAEDEVPLSSVIASIRHCVERCREDYRLLYLAMLYSGGARLEQLLSLLPFSDRYWLPRGSRPRPYGRYNAPRALEGRGLESKPIDWVWLPADLYGALRRVDPPKPGAARMYYSKHRIVTPTMLRSFCWQAGKYVLGDKDLVRLLQGRVGELKRFVTVQSYDDLRYQLDELYPRWLAFVDRLVEAAKSGDPSAEAGRVRREYGLPLPA
jgi:hypothetical protein